MLGPYQSKCPNLESSLIILGLLICLGKNLLERPWTCVDCWVYITVQCTVYCTIMVDSDFYEFYSKRGIR